MDGVKCCSICLRNYWGDSHDAEPIARGFCCARCAWLHQLDKPKRRRQADDEEADSE